VSASGLQHTMPVAYQNLIKRAAELLSPSRRENFVRAVNTRLVALESFSEETVRQEIVAVLGFKGISAPGFERRNGHGSNSLPGRWSRRRA
jgi:hypothetical protein